MQMRRGPTAFSRDCTEDSDIPSSCEMKDESPFKPLQGNPTSLESGNLGIHSTGGRKLRVTLTYILLREGSPLGACGKLAYLFNRILGISSLLETLWGA